MQEAFSQGNCLGIEIGGAGAQLGDEYIFGSGGDGSGSGTASGYGIASGPGTASGFEIASGYGDMFTSVGGLGVGGLSGMGVGGEPGSRFGFEPGFAPGAELPLGMGLPLSAGFSIGAGFTPGTIFGTGGEGGVFDGLVQWDGELQGQDISAPQEPVWEERTNRGCSW